MNKTTKQHNNNILQDLDYDLSGYEVKLLFQENYIRTDSDFVSKSPKNTKNKKHNTKVLTQEGNCLLVSGFLRNNEKMEPIDILIHITSLYLGFNIVNLIFHNPFLNQHGGFAMCIILHPFSHYSEYNSSSYAKRINNKQVISLRNCIKIKAITNECSDYRYNNNHFNFQFGIIGVPININGNDVKNKNKKLKKKNNNFLNLQSIFEELSAVDGNYGCSFGSIMKKSKHFEDCETFYLHFVQKYGVLMKISFGRNNDRDNVIIYDSKKRKNFKKTDKSSNETLLKLTDEICLKIETDELGKQQLYFFVKNDDDTIIGSNINEKEFKSGKIELNCEEYIYYAGLSSLFCNCKDCKGFTFEICV